MSADNRCALPFHPDPGQPQTYIPGEKIYLVSGRDCQKPGAYVSWPSASAELNLYATASLKTYYAWPLAESAWWAGCGRGEHGHAVSNTAPAGLRVAHALVSPPSPRPKTSKKAAAPTSPTASPSKARSPRSQQPLPVFHIPSRSPSPQAPAAASSRSKSAGARSKSAAAVAPKSPAVSSRSKSTPALSVGRRVYAVRCRDGLGGAVFSSFSEARDWYHAKHAAGLAPALVTADSLTAGVNLLEDFLGVDEQMHERTSLVQEEAKARRRKVKADMERAKHRLRGPREAGGSAGHHGVGAFLGRVGRVAEHCVAGVGAGCTGVVWR
ncbi:hypothetical protein B0H11DRAFT_2232988 [Mycena galericulata]|nr:hypothetical protein B0H11DRAFT_2232988 [Mycena galericulata]